MGVVVLNALLDFGNGLIDKLDSPFPVAALVVRGRREVPLCFSEMLNSSSHFGLFFASATFPSAVPGAIAPLPSAPAAELRAINCTAFAIFEHTLLPIRPARINAKCLLLPLVGVDAKSAVPHAKSAVLAGQF